MGGNCSKAFEFDLGPRSLEREPVVNTDLTRPRSDPNDGPRGLQHPSVPPHQRRTAAALRFRGNPGLVPTSANGFAVDLRDLSSHDLCAYAAGPVEVMVGTGGETDAPGVAQTLEGSIFRSPSPRGAESVEALLAGAYG